MDIRLALMTGVDIPVPECQLVIHQPTIQEISLIGEQDFFTGVQTFCVNKNLVIQDESLLSNITNFQILMTIMSEKETADKKLAVQQICPLFFPNYKVSFLPRSIVFRCIKDENIITIDETNFDFLQEKISEICCLKTSPGDTQNFNPQSKKAREIAQKLMRGRQRVAAQKRGTDSSILSQYVSTLAIGLGSMPLESCLKLTIFQLYDLIQRYGLYINWDIDIRSRLAGAKIEKPPEDWMKNIH